MNLLEKKSHYVLSPKVHTITNDDVNEIFMTMNSLRKPVVIDLEGVEDCVSDFYRMFEMFSNITLLNIESKLLSTLYMTGFDKFVTIYGDEVSFKDKLHELINRRFKII